MKKTKSTVILAFALGLAAVAHAQPGGPAANVNRGNGFGCQPPSVWVLENGGAICKDLTAPPPPPPVIVPPPSQEVQLFTECGFQGRSMRLLPGRNLFLVSPFSRNISSIRVPYRRRVTVYTGVNFTGHSWTLTGDNSCLNGLFNNRIQSIIVEAY